MDNRILIADNWQERIRNKLGVEESYLPNDDIEQPDIITVAETNIICQIPTYETLEGDLRVYLESSVVLECCILVCPSMPIRLPKKESGPHASQELGIDWEKKKAEFENEKNIYINKIIDAIAPGSIPKVNSFIVTFPKRGW